MTLAMRSTVIMLIPLKPLFDRPTHKAASTASSHWPGVNSGRCMPFPGDVGLGYILKKVQPPATEWPRRAAVPPRTIQKSVQYIPHPNFKCKYFLIILLNDKCYILLTPH